MTEENAVETTEETEVDPIRAAFDEVVNELSEDEIKMRMIHAGAKFNNVTRLYNMYMVDAGMVMSQDERKELAKDILEGNEEDLATEDGFNQCVEAIMENGTGVTSRSAIAVIKKYCKENSITCYTKPKSTGAARVSFTSKFYATLTANPHMTEAECHDYLFGLNGHEETSQNVKNYERMYQGIRSMVNDIAAILTK